MKLNQENRKKLAENEKHIKKLNSSQLLEYSKNIRNQREALGEEVYNYLLEVVDERRNRINSGLDVKKICELEKAVKQFKKKAA